MKVIHNAAKEDHSECDCILVVILTRGDVNTTDTLFSYDKPYLFKEVWSKFTADKCKTLAEKPKIFLVQAYQGGKSSEGGALETKSYADCDGNSSNCYRIPDHADFLLVYATPPGFHAFRSRVDGSWFIQSFCAQLEENGTKLELLKLMTRVLRRVALEYEVTDTPDYLSEDGGIDSTSIRSKCEIIQNHPVPGTKQIPVIQSMLIRKFFFTPKHKKLNAQATLGTKSLETRVLRMAANWERQDRAFASPWKMKNTKVTWWEN